MAVNPIGKQSRLGDGLPSYNTAMAGYRGSLSATNLSTSFDRLKNALQAPSRPPGSSSSVSLNGGTSHQVDTLEAGSPKKGSGWLGIHLGSSRMKDEEVRQTIQDLIKNYTGQGSVSALQDCVQACRMRGSHVSFEDIAQEPFIESHTPLYWAILKHKMWEERSRADSRGHKGDSPPTGIIDILVSFPLKPATLADARQACRLSSSQDLFQRIYRSQQLFQSGPASLINPASHLPDEIQVKNLTVDECPGAPENGAFRASLEIRHFQHRMRVLHFVRQEFIAQNRLWAITFYAYTPKVPQLRQFPPGSWLIAVEILDESPSTYLNCRLTMHPAPPVSSKTKQALVETMKSENLAPTPPTSDESLPGPITGTPVGCYVSASAPTCKLPEQLQYDGSCYVNSNGNFRVIFEATLAPGSWTQNAGCIIC